MSNPTVIEMVAEYLREHGYDGLVETDLECGCVIGELAPCGEIGGSCQAAYEAPGKDGYDFLMVIERPACHNVERATLLAISAAYNHWANSDGDPHEALQNIGEALGVPWEEVPK